jgi:hypothetical protein|tara:strand:+ start:2050 stop:3237 length:1188 start_codon:yes stop_codon:yes gene_type:complete
MGILKEIKKHIFPTIVALSALSVSISAAFYSVSGLSKLFAGATYEVIVMASSLEVAKLVIASLLYQYWNKINRLLRVYLTLATIILVLITSAGIYGFLSAAYQETATKSGIVDKKVEVMELRKNRFTENRDYLITEKEVLDNSISSLRNGLSNNVIQYKDRESGEIITTTSSSTRKALQKELNSAVSQREKLSVKLETATDSINSIDIKILNTESTAEISSELGPLKYLSELTDKPMNKIINILLLVIIFVFDPLAISLVIAANFAFNQIKNKDEEKEKDITRTSLDISKEAGKIEKKLVSKEPKPLEVSDELLNKLQTQLDKIGEESSKKQKIVTPTDDLLKNIDKLSEVIDLESDVEKQSENKEHNKVTPQQNKRVLTYRRRDGGRNTETDRA